MKHSLSKLALALVASLGMAGSAIAAPVVIDFDSTATGTYSSLTFGAVTITFLDGTGMFDVASATPGPPISGGTLISWFTNPGTGAFQATFAGGASSVSIGMGDFNADEDEGNMRAYDAANNLLDTDYLFVAAPVYGGGTMTVTSSTAIARVEWNETGTYAGAVYWDNLSYEASGPTVPEPASLALVLAALGGAGFASRKRAAK